MKQRLSFVPFGILCAIGLSVQVSLAVDSTKADHVMIHEKDLIWKDGPQSLPSGTKISVMEGDLTKEGPFTVRLKFPSGTQIAPHYHPAVEHLTILKGQFFMGFGEKWDDKMLTEMQPGSFMAMKEGTRHFAMAKSETELQLHGMGPWGITYVNPEDNPMRKVSKAK